MRGLHRVPSCIPAAPQGQCRVVVKGQAFLQVPNPTWQLPFLDCGPQMSPTGGNQSQRAAAHRKRHPQLQSEPPQQRGHSSFVRHWPSSELCHVPAPGRSEDKGEPEQPP